MAPVEGGALCIEVEGTSIILDQSIGKEVIEITERGIIDWLSSARSGESEYAYARMSVFDLFCYRRRSGRDGPPTIERVDGFKRDRESKFCGLVFYLSTGTLIGVDASSDDGLKFFLDGRYRLFENEYVDTVGLKRVVFGVR